MLRLPHRRIRWGFFLTIHFAPPIIGGAIQNHTKQKGFTLKEFFVHIMGVHLTDTYNGDIPDWRFYVTTVDVTIASQSVKLGTFRRGDVRYIVACQQSVDPKPSIEDCKHLVQWQHDYMKHYSSKEGYAQWRMSR